MAAWAGWVAALAAASLAAWFASRAIKAEARLAAAREAEEAAGATFEKAAQEALRTAHDDFLRQAKETLGASKAEIRSDLGELVRPVGDGLKALEKATKDLEVKREGAYKELTKGVEDLSGSAGRLQERVGALDTALRGTAGPQGAWGEMALRNLVERAGMVEHCDFEEQATVAGDEGALRPDLSVRLPGGRVLFVDAKVSVKDFMAAVSAGSEEERAAAMAKHVQAVRAHVRRLAGREYQQALPESLDLVVMFLPGESMFAAALEADADLMEEAMRRGVVLASPTTLLALLKNVAFYWRQEQVAEGAREIHARATELHNRVRVFVEHLTAVSKGLVRAVGGFNKAVSSYRSRVLPSGRRLEEIGGGGKPLPEIDEVDDPPTGDLPAGEDAA